MIYRNLRLVIVPLIAVSVIPFAKEGVEGGGGGGEGDGSTSSVSSGYDSSRSTDKVNANLGYTNNLTKNLLFQFDVGLSSSYNASEKREIQNHSIRISNNYDPPSPWKLDVIYSYNRSNNYRPEDLNQDEYKAFTRNHSLRSSVSYALTKSMRTYLDINLNNAVKESIVAGQWNPDTSSSNKSIASSVEYDITPNTTFNLKYTGGINSTEYTGSSQRIADPIPPPKKGRTENSTIFGNVSSNNSLSDSIDIDISLNATNAAQRDLLLPGLDNTGISGSAGSVISFDPSTKFTFSNNTNLSRKLIEYPHKREYEEEFSEKIYDTDDTTLINSSEITIKPSGGSSATFTYAVTTSKRYRYKDGKVMPTEVEDPVAVNSIYEDVEHRLVSGVNAAIGENLTFHLTHYYSSSHPDYIRNESKNKLTNVNNLDSNLGYDITEKLRSDVNTILNFKNVKYDDADSNVDDTRNSSISLSNNFTYRPSLLTKLTLKFLVEKKANDYINNPGNSYENINREINSEIRQEIGKLLDLSCGFLYKYNYTNFLGSSASNIRQNTIKFTPTGIINISDSLFSSINFTYERITKWNPVGEESEIINSWRQTHNYLANFNVTYTPFKKFTVNFKMGSGHNFRLEHKEFRIKKNEDDDYYNVSLDMNYEW